MFPAYPAGLLPRSSGRRGRRHGIGWFVWLGSHPVLTVIAVVINLYVLAFVLAWIVVVTLGWLVCGLAVLPFRLGGSSHPSG